MEIEIRRLTAADGQVLERVAQDVFDEAIDTGRLTDYLATPGHLMVVAMSGDEVVGQVAAVIHRHPDKPTELYVDEVGVTPTLWRRGIARRMMGEMFAWGRELGCEESWVGTETDNVPARRLYETLGAEAETIVMFLYDL